MKVEDLEVGKMYKCILSDQEMLVVEGDKIIIPAKGKQPQVTEKVKAGKSCIKRDGMPSFLHNELHDGQLIELKK